MEKEFVKDLVSVIVPCYNVGDYVARCVKSIVENSYTNLEIICINDGSTDHTLEELKPFAGDPRVKIIDQVNQGVSMARNNGMDVCTGEFICNIDPDDWVHKDFFQKLVDAQRQSDADVVMCGYSRVEGFVEDAKLPSAVAPKMYNGEDVWAQTTFKNYAVRKLTKRSYIGDIVYLKGVNICEDILFNVETLVANPDAKYAVIEDELYYYYNRPGSLSRTFTGENLLLMVNGISKAISKANPTYQVVVSRETIKYGLAARYKSMFRLNKKAVDKECAVYFDLALKTMKGKVSFVEYFKYLILTKMPSVYRLFRISTDRTLIEWERNQKLANQKT